MQGVAWSEEHTERLRVLWKLNTPTAIISAELNRTDDAITNKARGLRLGARDQSRWTDEMDDILRASFGNGASFRDIGLRLGVSRSAAIGRADRLGMTRNKPSAPTGSAEEERPIDRRRMPNVVTFRPKVIRTDTDSPPLPGSRPRPWLERDVKGGPRLCCWPVDVPGADVQHSCCMPRDLGHKSYCSAHADLSVGRVSAANVATLSRSPTISAAGAETASRAEDFEENQSGRAVRKHQPYPGKLQTMEV